MRIQRRLLRERVLQHDPSLPGHERGWGVHVEASVLHDGVQPGYRVQWQGVLQCLRGGNRWPFKYRHCKEDGHPTVSRVQTIRWEGKSFSVREVSRPHGWQCRLLAAETGELFLEYLVSVGPYKIDIEVVHALSESERAAYQSGTLQLGELARTIAESDMKSGRHERR